MRKINNTSIVIPCYNEEENIHNLFSTWKKTIEGKYEIFVNNEWSKTSSLNYKENTDNQIKVLNLKENEGYGGGIQGFKNCKWNILSLPRRQSS